MKISDNFEAKYTLYDYINGGTYGKVYKCCKKDEKMEYAVKIQDVSLNDNSYVSILTEAKIWNCLEHKNIVKLYECFLQDDQFYFVMELVPGSNLFDEILRKSTYSETNACLYIKQILSALAYLHVNKIIHRDVKPDNIMLYQDLQKGSGSVVKLVDFGLARKLENGKNRIECAPSGAPLYLAPETIMEVALGWGRYVHPSLWFAPILVGGHKQTFPCYHRLRSGFHDMHRRKGASLFFGKRSYSRNAC